MSKVIVGVTGPDNGGTAAWWFTRFAVWRAGGKARRLQPQGGAYSATDVLDGVAAVIIGGGADVDVAAVQSNVADLMERERVEAESAAEQVAERDAERTINENEMLKGTDRRGLVRRGAVFIVRTSWWLVNGMTGLTVWAVRRLARTTTSDETPLMDAHRDTFETNVIRLAAQRRIPVLGICRGAQLLSVVRGGLLHESLASFYVESVNPYTPLPCKTVRIEPESALAKALAVDANTDIASVRVNALHHQAVRDCGPEQRLVAWEHGNNVVQAVEGKNMKDWWTIGVQWHPEYMPQSSTQVTLFRALIDAGKQYQDR